MNFPEEKFCCRFCAVTMSDIPVAKSKSALDHITAVAFSRRSGTRNKESSSALSKLEQDRKEMQEEISKLTMILCDQTISLTNDEILEINDEVNDLITSRQQIEKDILRSSHGQINYIDPKSVRGKMYFGRAKNVHEEQLVADAESKKKRSITPETIKETSSKEECVQEILRKSVVDSRVQSKTKKTRFDDDDEE